MTNPNNFFVDKSGQTTKNGVAIAPDGTAQLVTHDITGQPVVTSLNGGGAGTVKSVGGVTPDGSGNVAISSLNLTDGVTLNASISTAQTAAAAAQATATSASLVATSASTAAGAAQATANALEIVSTAWSTTWTTSAFKDMGKYTITGALALVSLDTASVIGGYTRATIITNGTNTPTLDGVAISGWPSASGVYVSLELKNIGGAIYWSFNAGAIPGRAVLIPTAPVITTAPVLTQVAAGVAVAWTAGTVTGYPAPTVSYSLSKNGVVVASPATSGTYTSTVNGDVMIVTEAATNSVGTATPVASLPMTVQSAVNGAVAAPTITGAPAYSVSWDFGDSTKVTMASGAFGQGGVIASITGSDGTTVVLPAGSNGGPLSVIHNGQYTALFSGPGLNQFMQVTSDAGMNAANAGTLIAVGEFDNTTTGGVYDFFEIGNPTSNYASNRIKLGYGDGNSGIAAIWGDGSYGSANQASPLYSGTGPRCIIGVFPNGSTIGLYSEGQAAAIAGTSGAFPGGITTITVGGSQNGGSVVSNCAPIYLTRLMGVPASLTNTQAQIVQSWAWSNYSTYGKPIAAATIQRPVIGAVSAGATSVSFTPGQMIGYPIPTATYALYKNSTLLTSSYTSGATIAAVATNDLIQIVQNPTNSTGVASNPNATSSILRVGAVYGNSVPNGVGVVGAILNATFPTGFTPVSYQWYRNISSAKNLVGQVAISGATSIGYTPVSGDIGYVLTCTGTDASGGQCQGVEFGNVIVSSPNVSPVIPQFTSPNAATATRPSYNTGAGFFVLNGDKYDANGNRFNDNANNQLHWDSGYGSAVYGCKMNALRQFLDFSKAFSVSIQPNLDAAKAANCVAVPVNPNVVANFNGGIVGSVLTVTAMIGVGYFCMGQQVYSNSGATLVGTISSYGTGTGQLGTYNLSSPTAVAAGTTLLAYQASPQGTTNNPDPSTLIGCAQIYAQFASSFKPYERYIMPNLANEWGPCYDQFQGSVSGSTLTVTYGAVQPSMLFEYGSNIYQLGQVFTGTGTGGAGTYPLITSPANISSTVTLTNVTWRETCKTAIGIMRTAGYLGTLIIDAPGNGQDCGNFGPGATLLKHSTAVFNSDPQKNIAFSLHVYGGYFPGGSLNTTFSALRSLQYSAGMNFIIGEYGPGQNVGLSPTILDPLEVMATADANCIGRYGWAYDDHSSSSPPEVPPSFCMSYDWYTNLFSLANLTPYGLKVVDDPVRGSLTTAVPATIF